MEVNRTDRSLSARIPWIDTQQTECNQHLSAARAIKIRHSAERRGTSTPNNTAIFASQTR